MDRFAVAGRPVLHSRSPRLFNAYFEGRGLAARYTRIAAESAEEAMFFFRETGLRGMNVTSPFKEEIVPRLEALDPAAERIGAVNTVIREVGRLKGFNTDHLGVAGALADRGVDPGGRPCLVLGAGGAGRAAAYALLGKSGRVTILNRDVGKARRAASNLDCAAGSLEDLNTLITGAFLIVNTIPQGRISFGDIPFRAGQVVVNADYRDSYLQRAAVSQGAAYIGGEAWLLHQAVPALRLFLGEDVPADALGRPESILSTEPKDRPRNIALIGFMGAGKSAVGRVLAARLGWKLLDTDEWIAGREGMTVPEIFRTRGEDYFRCLEKEVVSNFAPTPELVLACGGGAVMNEENRRRLAEHSLVVWITASVETVFRRSGMADRPLLDHPEPMVRAERLLRERRDDYFRSADLVVGNEGDVDRTSGRIYEEIRIVF